MLRPSYRALPPTMMTLLALLQGCGGCGGAGTPPAQSTPKPVQGGAPQAQAPAVAPVTAPEAKNACAVLIFSSVDGGPAPLSAQLTAEGDCTKGTARYEWDFGDGSPKATGEAVVHTFEKPGTYTVKGRITSDELPGLEDVDDTEIVVTSPQG